jgi:hypothetical protein
MASPAARVAVALAFALPFLPIASAAAPPAQLLPPGVTFDDASMLEHADDVADYTLSAKLDATAHTVHGEGTIRWRNASSAPVTELWLHLYLNAFKTDKSAFLREPVGFRTNVKLSDHGQIDVRKLALHTDAGATDLWPSAELHRPGDEDETDARVPLPHEVAPGETITLDVVWDDKLPSVIARTGYSGSFHMVGQWFPKLARLEPSGEWAHFPFHKLAEFYADFGTYDVTLDVPSTFTIGATGNVLDAHVAGDRRIERHLQKDVHDFAWSAWDGFEAESETIDGVAVTVLHPRGFRLAGQRELAAMRFAIPYFGARYGRYPYDVLTLVHPPEGAGEAGGMEYPTLITTGGRWFDLQGVRLLEHVTIHEFGHQYFYGLIASNEEKWPFLDEGINEYATEEALADWVGSGSIVDVAGLHIDITAIAAVVSNRAASNEPVAQPAYDFTTGDDYGTLVYFRTAAVFDTLRRVYGDAAVARALGTYARAQRFRHPGPDALLHAFSDVLGADVAATLRTALFDKGWVDYVAMAMDDHVDGGVHDGWALVLRRGTLSFPVDVELRYADGSSERRVWDGSGDSMRFAYAGAASALRSVVVDPDRRVTLDQNYTNDAMTATDAPKAGAPNALERATYFADLLVQAVGP